MNIRTLILAVGLMASGLAQSQEAVSRSETVNSRNAAGDAITTYTTYRTTYDHGQTKVDTYIQVDTEYAAVCNTFNWTWSRQAPTSVSYTKRGEWTGRSDLEPVPAPVDYGHLAKRTETVQAPVTVVTATETPAESRARSLDGAQRVRLQQEAEAKARKSWKPFVNGE